MHVPLIVIGGGLSGLAAAIRFARFIPDVLLLEQHSRLGGLNSYYFRNNTLFETGLHAITNYAGAKDKKAPLNRLLRQLKIDRGALRLHEQVESEIHFAHHASLRFSNDFQLLQAEIERVFPNRIDAFRDLLRRIDDYDPFAPAPFRSARAFLKEQLGDPLLIDMLLCPLMYYGSSVENDMDLGQFIIMFRAIFQEGMFRPEGSIKDFLDLLITHYQGLGGAIRLKSRVARILKQGSSVHGVELDSGEVIECDFLLSTIGYEETLATLETPASPSQPPRLGFIESIFQLPTASAQSLPAKTIIFFNRGERFRYERPENPVDFNSGVICFPQNFQGLSPGPFREVRSTHLANYHHWHNLHREPERYCLAKQETARSSLAAIEKIIGNFAENIVYEDTFTPVTIERFTTKKEGAIYGSPTKIKDGDLGYTNLFLAGTDQGFLGIVGSMLSGVSMINQHILPRV